MSTSAPSKLTHRNIRRLASYTSLTPAQPTRVTRKSDRSASFSPLAFREYATWRETTKLTPKSVRLIMASIDWKENQRPESEEPRFLITKGTATSAANAPQACWYHPANVPARAGWALIQELRVRSIIPGS